MAQQGYWVVCEDLYADDDADIQTSTCCIGHITGFHYAEAMGGSRMEVLTTIKNKLNNNIRFLYDCYDEIPSPSTSDNPPSENNIINAAYIFVGLEEIGIKPEMLQLLST